ncbi:MAG: SDR family NAD(P)-dependent oxidoreductase [Thermoplasmataceae archaeon]
MEKAKPLSVLVTGGTRGIGRAISLKMAEEGYDVIAVYRNNDLKIKELSSKINGMGRTCTLYKTDLTNENERLKLVNELRNSNVQLKALVNNAGMGRSETLDSVDIESWDKVIRLNETVPLLMARDLHNLIKEGGSIINIGSLRGVIPSTDLLSYQASKASLMQITRALAKTLAPKIRVNSIVCGWIRTDMTKGLHTDDNMMKLIESWTPMERWGEPEDVAEMASFLISNKASFITGQGFVLDGGVSLLKNI